ncbi:MAG: hypothetical protein M3176_05845 [Chloroflexota bacterium]|nr:hypothetical protein [Chloroflexota bacterium]
MTNTERIRIAAIACTIGGVLWVLNVLLGVVANQQVHRSAAIFRAWEAVFILLQVLLLIGVVGLAWSGATGDGRLGRIGLGIALVGRFAFVLGETHSFVRGSDDSPLMPVGALATGIGMILVGIAVVRARRWEGWHRMIPLLAGIYPFVAMFPILAATGNPPEVMIMFWGFLWILLGLVLYAEEAMTGAMRQSPSASAFS